MVIKEEFLELLRTDPSFREEVRRQVLTEDLLALPKQFDRSTERFDKLTERVSGMADAIRALTEAQQRTEVALQQTHQELRELISWQHGEAGRRDGTRFERNTIQRAFVLFNGGQGGSPDQERVSRWLAERLSTLKDFGTLAPDEDPFLAGLIWHKRESTAVVEISLQVNHHDIIRAAQRADALRRAGVEALAVVIGDEWATLDSQAQAVTRHVEWKVGSDLSQGLLAFRRAPSG